MSDILHGLSSVGLNPARDQGAIFVTGDLARNKHKAAGLCRH